MPRSLTITAVTLCYDYGCARACQLLASSCIQGCYSHAAVCAGASRLPFAMQLHAAMIRCLEGSGCSAEAGKAILNLLICLLPCLPLKAPQQRAWAAACAAATLQLCARHCHGGACTLGFLCQR